MSSLLTPSVKAAIDRVKQPIESASGMPNEAFERDNLLGQTWTAPRFIRDLPQPGYLKPYNFMGIPLLIVRDKKDKHASLRRRLGYYYAP